MGLLITTLSLAIAATNPTGESEYNSDLNLNLGQKYYISPAAAGSEGSWYFKPSIAINNIDDITVPANFLDLGFSAFTVEFDKSTSLSLGFGFHITENVRLEFGYFESDNDIKNSDVLGVGSNVTLEQETISIVALLDFATGSAFTPYVGGGIAIMDSKLTYTGYSSPGSDDTTMIFCMGLDWALNGNMDIYAEYRMSTPTYEHLDGSNIDVDNGTLMFGLNWRF